MQNNAQFIIPIASLEKAYKLKKKNPHYLLMGERGGKIQPGFDYGNSPTEILNTDFSNKVVIQTTTAGTQAISGVLGAQEMISGAFVNARAVFKYIQKRKPKAVSLICTDASIEDNEDIMFAKYVKSHIEGKPMNFVKIKKHLEKHPCAKGYLINPMTELSKQDFYLSLHLDRFDFVLKAKKDKNKLIKLIKEHCP